MITKFKDSWSVWRKKVTAILKNIGNKIDEWKDAIGVLNGSIEDGGIGYMDGDNVVPIDAKFVPKELPTEGNVGDVLKKTATGTEWGQAGEGNQLFIVTFSKDEDDNYVCDKSFEEVLSAYKNGKMMCAYANVDDDEYMFLWDAFLGSDEDYFGFFGVTGFDTTTTSFVVMLYRFDLKDDNSVEYIYRSK